MKRNMLFVVDKKSYNEPNHIGVRKKVQTQANLFEKNGINVKICQYEWKHGLPDFKVDSDTGVLYFRTIGASIQLAIKLMVIRRRVPGIKIVMEIPTYLNISDYYIKKGLKRKINEKIGELLWKYCLDRIVIIRNEAIKEVYGVPALHANNGVSFDDITLREVHEGEIINLIAVSGCYYWHGYDRLINGLGEYYSEHHDREVNLYIVGEGDCKANYMELAKKYNILNQHVFFCGLLAGEDLNLIYNRCDIGVESFGGHRNGCDYSSSLKSREYAAKGLPIVTSIRDLDYENELTRDVIRKFPADESYINIYEIISFYDKIYSSSNKNVKRDVACRIREEFRNLCDIEYTFKDVVNYLVE